MSDKISYSNFKLLGPKTALLYGKVGARELAELRNWFKTIAVQRDIGYVLLLDSAGGFSDPSLVVDLIQLPVHTHILNVAESFAALLFLGGSIKTCSPQATFMLHKAQWDSEKSSEAIAEDKALLSAHRLKVKSLISTLAPCGDAKLDMIDAVCGEEDVYFDLDRLYETGVIDFIGDLSAEQLNLYKGNELWFNRKYKEGDTHE